MTAQNRVTSLMRSETLTIPIGLLHDLGAARTVSESLNAFAFWSSKIVKSERCSVALPEGDNLTVTGLAGNGVIATGATMPIKGTFIGRVFATETADVLGDLHTHNMIDAQKLHEAGMRTIMIAPLLAGDQCFGTLAFAFTENCRSDRDRLHVIKGLAQCLATQLLVLDQIEELQRLVQIDTLTSAYNRRYLESVEDTLWDAWTTEGTPFATVTVDIDHFKRVNDTHGHALGDEVLQSVAARLRHCVRPEDSVIRLGGEEFLLVLEDCDDNRAQDIANRAHAAICDKPFVIPGAKLGITVSAGVAAVVAKDNSVSDVCERSDKALYEAKRDGRNRVIAA